ncbi:MAG: dTMP kinase [Pedosphaera sp.]|nr:dTMP kinase [Pedosphaera sp.]
MSGRFITFEGTEGCGKSTHIKLLAERLTALGHKVKTLREPGGTPLCEEIRRLLKHAPSGRDMTPETELLLMNASRAQLVREAIRPALDAGNIVLCDRFYDSTTAYQGYGRQLDLDMIRRVVDLAVGPVRPHLTLLLQVPATLSESRCANRKKHQTDPDRFEEADRDFFNRVERGFAAIAAAEPDRVRVIDASRPVEVVSAEILRWTETLLRR